MLENSLLTYKIAAIIHLEKLQKEILRRYGLELESIVGPEEYDPLLMSELYNIFKPNTPYDQWIKQQNNLLKDAEEKKFTQYEHRSWFIIMQDITADIESVLQGLPSLANLHYIFGTMPMHAVNGAAISIPSNPYRLIVMQHGLFEFYHLMSKIIAQSFMIEVKENDSFDISIEMDDCARQINSNPEICKRLWDLFYSYLIGGSAFAADQYILKSEHIHLARELHYGMTGFSVGHEFGHLIARHFERDSSDYEYQEFEPKMEMMLIKWEQEYEADNIAANILARLMVKKKDNQFMYYANMDCCLGCFWMLEKGVGILKNGILPNPDLPSATHPPIKLRRELLRVDLERKYGLKSTRMIRIAETIDYVLKLFWENIEPRLKMLHDEGIQVHPLIANPA